MLPAWQGPPVAGQGRAPELRREVGLSSRQRVQGRLRPGLRMVLEQPGQPPPAECAQEPFDEEQESRRPCPRRGRGTLGCCTHPSRNRAAPTERALPLVPGSLLSREVGEVPPCPCRCVAAQAVAQLCPVSGPRAAEGSGCDARCQGRTAWQRSRRAPGGPGSLDDALLLTGSCAPLASILRPHFLLASPPPSPESTLESCPHSCPCAQLLCPPSPPPPELLPAPPPAAPTARLSCRSHGLTAA